MFIRRTSIKSRRSGEPYYAYRLVESLRTEQGVRQRTLANLGRHFDVPKEQWPNASSKWSVTRPISCRSTLTPNGKNPHNAIAPWCSTPRPA